jgi:hypothetical protein
MKIIFAILSLVVLFVICGCTSREQKALNSFKPIIAFLGSQTNHDGGIEFSDFSYNVEKRDSLVSPFVGLITFKNHTKYHDLIYTCRFAEQDEKWVHKSIDIEETQTAEGISYEEDYEKNMSDEVRAKQQASHLQVTQLTIKISKMSLDGELADFLHCQKTISDNPL